MFVYKHRVSYSEVDPHGRSTLVSLMNYLQDCSTFESDALGFAVCDLDPTQATWILGGWHLAVHDRPHFGDSIQVRTWAHDLKRTRVSRNFVIEPLDARSAWLEADSLWFMYNPQTKHIERLPQSVQSYPQDAAPLDLPGVSRSLSLPEDLTLNATRSSVVGLQQLDANRHVNNAQYVAYAEDALAQHDIVFVRGNVDILYHAMAFEGDTIQPYIAFVPDGDTPHQGKAWVQLSNAKTNTLYCILRYEGVFCE